MNNTQFAAWQDHMGVAKGEEWEPMATVKDPDSLRDFLSRVPFFAQGPPLSRGETGRARH